MDVLSLVRKHMARAERVSLPGSSIPPPDEGHYIPRGRVLAAEFGARFALPRRPGGRRGARRQGEIYESRVQSHLEDLYGERYCASPWISYFESGRWRLCQPDALLLDLDRAEVHIIEIKLKHTPQAWWQLRRLYAPVMEKLFPRWPIQVCEVVHWYEPIDFPEHVKMVPFVDDPSDNFKVHIWNP